MQPNERTVAAIHHHWADPSMTEATTRSSLQPSAASVPSPLEAADGSMDECQDTSSIIGGSFNYTQTRETTIHHHSVPQTQENAGSGHAR